MCVLKAPCLHNWDIKEGNGESNRDLNIRIQIFAVFFASFMALATLLNVSESYLFTYLFLSMKWRL